MKTSIGLLALSLVLCPPAAAQNPAPNPADSLNRDSVFTAGFDELLSYLLLTRSDFTFRDDYTDRDSFRLAIVDSLMRRPLDMMPFVDTTARRFADFGADHHKIYSYLAALFGAGKSIPPTGNGGAASRKDNPRDIKIKNLPGKLHEPLQRACGILSDMQETLKRQMGGDWDSERDRFIAGQFKELLLMDVADETRPLEVIDSLEKIDEEYALRFARLASDIGQLPALESLTSDSLDIFRQIDLIYTLLTTDRELLKRAASGKPLLAIDSPYGRIVIGGNGNDTYRGDYFIIIDPGGDDSYYLTYDIAHPHSTLIADCTGNDYYRAESDFAIASGAFSNSFLVDYAGDDTYLGRNFSVASGYFGSGILWDKKGNDRYFGDTFTQGAGAFGLGLLVDNDGADTYTGNLYCQGFGYVRGIGGIIDYEGNDIYTVQPKYKDVLGYTDRYFSLSQGFAYGVRPAFSGGFGFICDYAGNDLYVSDIFGQGSGYWWSLGMIYDRSGNDQYISYQYAQGAGAHMAVGILLDEAGDDVYRSHGVSQGCGHDYSCGWMLDWAGNDVYSSFSLSQGAGSANGIGIITDIGGADGYYIFDNGNCQGYGNPRRDYGSIGFMLDLGGIDHYDGNGVNDRFWRTPSKWGGGLDREIFPAKTGETK